MNTVPTNYQALVKWGYTQSQYSFDEKALDSSVQSLMDNIDRLRSVSLLPAVVAAHAGGKGNVKEGLVFGADATEALTVVPVVRDGLYHLFANVVVGAWTAFESVATDVWIACVNARPMLLGLKAMTSQQRSAEAGADKSAHAKTKAATVSVNVLAKYRFDVKERLGYVLWRERYSDFNTYYGLKDAFRAIIDDSPTWFDEPVFGELVTLEAMRQVFVHRGGRVDQHFIDRVKTHAVLSKLRRDDPLRVEGPIAAASAELALVCGLKLLDRAGDWLAANPEPEKSERDE